MRARLLIAGLLALCVGLWIFWPAVGSSVEPVPGPLRYRSDRPVVEGDAHEVPADRVELPAAPVTALAPKRTREMDRPRPESWPSLEVEVRDAANGTLIETFTLRDAITIEAPVGGWFSRSTRRPDPGLHPGGRASVAGSAGSHHLTIESRGFQKWEYDWTPEPGDPSTTVAVSLDPGAEIAGIVVDEAGQPVADVDVGLFLRHLATTEQPGDPAPMRFVTDDEYWILSPPFDFMHVQSAGTKTNAAGEFRFTGLEDVSACVRAWRSPSVDVFVDKVSSGPSASGNPLRLVMPAGQLLHGHIAVSGDDRLWPGTIAGTPAVAGGRNVTPTVAAVAPDGSFELGPFPPGNLRLVAIYDAKWLDFELPDLATGEAVSLGSVVIAADQDLEANFDLGAAAPGSVRVRVLVDGVPASDIRVTPTMSRTGHQFRTALSGPSGWATLGALPPGPVDLKVWRDVHPHAFSVVERSLIIESGSIVEKTVSIWTGPRR